MSNATPPTALEEGKAATVIVVGEGGEAAAAVPVGGGGEGGGGEGERKDSLSASVAKIIEQGNKPIKMTLFGFKIAGMSVCMSRGWLGGGDWVEVGECICVGEGR
jgi:hypothetical protein